METLFGTYTSGFWESVNISAWAIFGKAIPLLLLIIWFFTCKHWWYHAILAPITMYVFQIISTVNDDIQFMDYEEIYFLIPIVAVIAAFGYTIRTQIFDKLYGVDLDQELKRVKWNGKIVKVPANSTLDLEEVDDTELDDEELEHDEDNEPMWMA